MNDEKLVETVGDLVREMAIVATKMENLTSTVVTAISDSKSQNERIDNLEKSRTQLLTLFSTVSFFLAGFGSLGLWIVDSHIDTRFNAKIQETDIRYLLCTKYRSGKQIEASELPTICH